MSKEIRRRYLPVDVAEFRAEETEEGKMWLEGYAAVYNRYSEELSFMGVPFKEIIRPGAFRKVLEKNPDVTLLFNHDDGSVMATTSRGNLTLEENQTGLKFRAELFPDDWDSKRVYSKVKNGLIKQCSFAFAVGEDGDDEKPQKDGTFIREIHEIGYLADVSVVTRPAYPQTTVQARSILQEAGFDFEGIASVIARAQRGLEVTLEDREKIEASIGTLRNLIPEELEQPGERGTSGDGQEAVGQLDLLRRQLDLVELEGATKPKQEVKENA